jgi:glycerate kinase
VKFVIAPDKFKHSLTATAFCNAATAAVRRVFPDAEVIQVPLADGGDGTLDVLQEYLKGEKISADASDPLFKKIKAASITT